MLAICWPTWAQSIDSDSQKAKTTTSTESKTNTESPSDLTTEAIPEETKKVYHVGQRVGQQIDEINQQES